MKVSLLRLGLVLLPVWVLILGGCNPPEPPPRQLKFSVVTAPDSSIYKAAVRFSELVQARTKGRLQITVHPNCELSGGNQLKEFEMLKSGEIDFTYDSNMFYATLDKRFGVISLPWGFSSLDDVDRFLKGSGGTMLLDLTKQYGIVGLAYGENGFRQITNSKRPIRKPSDLAGLKLRVPNVPIWFSVIKTLGAEPVIMTWPAVYKALQEGVVDGQENPLDIIASNKLYDIQKHITLWNYLYDAFILGVNAKLYNGLDEKTQIILREAAVEASAYQIQLSREAARTQTDFLKEKGMEVTVLSAEEVKAFRDLMDPIYAEYEPVFGKDLLDAVRGVYKK